jgi:hypothetical protein
MIETPIDVSCDSFQKYFGEDLSNLTIDDKQFLDSLAVILAGLRPSTKGSSPDVRLVMQIYYPHIPMKTVCMNRFVLELDGIEMEFEPRLFTLIQSELNKHDKKL